MQEQTQDLQTIDPFDPSTLKRNFEIGGVSWYLNKYSHGNELSYHSHNDGANAQIRSITKRKDGGYAWSFAWLVHADKENRESTYFCARHHGQEETLEAAAAAVLAYDPQPIEMVGLTWYPNGAGFISLQAGQEVTITKVDDGDWWWRREYPELKKIVGLLTYDPLNGCAATFSEAAEAASKAVEDFHASVANLRPQSDDYLAGYRAGLQDARQAISRLAA